MRISIRFRFFDIVVSSAATASVRAQGLFFTFFYIHVYDELWHITIKRPSCGPEQNTAEAKTIQDDEVVILNVQIGISGELRMISRPRGVIQPGASLRWIGRLRHWSHLPFVRCVNNL